ncbi:MAG: excinuclease ABC subunit UvrA [Culicoidibacterales bacterium]
MNKDMISIKGARENNLKDISIDIPKNKLVVLTGVSGSGKTSLAFNTIYAEGQRRYVESLSAYARQFLGNMEKPDVDTIEGLSPSISIDQKTTSRNPRSTVGTMTEIYDYFRLLFARIGVPYCPNHHQPIASQTVQEMVDRVLESQRGAKVQIMAPIVTGQKGLHAKVFERLAKDGFIRVRLNGAQYTIDELPKMDKNKKYTIEIVIDRIIVKEGIESRIAESIETALKYGEGKVVIDISGRELVMSEHFSCPHCDFMIPELEPRFFSFNAPFGACQDCSGLGTKLEIDKDILMSKPTESFANNFRGLGGFGTGISPESFMFTMLAQTFSHYGYDIESPVNKLPKKAIEIALYGSKEKIEFTFNNEKGMSHTKTSDFEGIINNLERRYKETTSEYIRTQLHKLMSEQVCPRCHGKRLSAQALSVIVGNKNISEVTDLTVKDALIYVDTLALNQRELKIATLVLKEIKDRLGFLSNVGIGYLNLSRMAGTLSGGESQRIRLATQIGSRLTGVTYVLDEPSIGLHQRDNEKLITTLKGMRDLGNSVLVVEHDEDTMLAADCLIDIGPRAGIHGGQVIAIGTPAEVMENSQSITGQYLSGKLAISIPKIRRKGNGKKLKIFKAVENNLKNITVEIPLGAFVCVTGVSGSGKSTLIHDILYTSLRAHYNRSTDKPGKHQKITGLEHIDKIINIDQSAIGRTPRSNPATYTGVFDDIRELFTQTTEAKMRGYQKGRFSFNVKGGRCEACQGDGITKIEMHFLPDVYVPCDVCKGNRYNRETLEIKYKDKNIYDVLEMTIEEACLFFENVPKVLRRLATILEVGLGYIKLGQMATTLSGGEAQRVKLSSELYKIATGKTLYILDEPTTGLHVHDVKQLIAVLQKIVDAGNTVLVIEHNLDIIKVSDHVIDLGPEGGDEGGEILVCGTPEQVAKHLTSYTGHFLAKLLNH